MPVDAGPRRTRAQRLAWLYTVCFETDGTATEAAGTATVAIGGACSGCGIAPMTMKAIERRFPESVDGLEDGEVVRSGCPRAAVMPCTTDEMEDMVEYEDYRPPL